MKPYTYIGNKGHPWIDFLMVIISSGIFCGHVHMMMAMTELPKMAAILQLDIQPWFMTSFFDIGHPCHGQLIHVPVKTRYPLTGSVTWPYCGLKFRAYWGHLFFFYVDRWPSAGQVFYWIMGKSQVKLLLLFGSWLMLTQD